MNPNKIISWNLFSLILVICTHIVQQVPYFIHFYGHNYAMIVFLLDVYILLYLLTNSSVRYGASKGGTYWVMYSWSLTIKVVLAYFLISPDDLDAKNVLFQLFLTLSLAFSSLVYILMGYRASEQLYRGMSYISTESMLHTDLILHVVVDLIDLSDAFYNFAFYPFHIYKTFRWLRLVAGILISLAVFLHAYSFPSVGSRDFSANLHLHANVHDKEKDFGDVLVVRKHAAFIGICFIDLPFATLRIYSWIQNPHVSCLSPFVLKNLCFIPIQLIRIKHCIVANTVKNQRIKIEAEYNKEHYRRSKRISFTNHISPRFAQIHKPNDKPYAQNTIPFVTDLTKLLLNVSESELHELGLMKEKKKKKGFRCGKCGWRGKRKKKNKDEAISESLLALENMRRQYNNVRSGTFSDTNTCTRLSYGFGEASNHACSVHNQSYKNNECTNGDEYNNEMFIEAGSELNEQWNKKAILLLIENIENNRKFPVAAMDFKRIVQRLMYSFRDGARQGRALLLDDIIKLSFFQKLRFVVPFMFFWVFQITIVCCLNNFSNDSMFFSIDMFELCLSPKDGFYDWSNIPLDIKLSVFIVLLNILIFLFCWILAAPILDVIFITFFNSLRILSFFLVCLTLRDFRVFNNMFGLKDNIFIPHIGEHFIWILAFEPVFGLLSTLYLVLCTLMGREYLSYVIPPLTKGGFGKASNKITRNNTFDTAKMMDYEIMRDESGAVSLASLIIFLNCRFFCAPISLHQLFIGPNFIRDIRSSDNLLYRHFNHIILVILVRLWCWSLYITYPQSITYGFDGHIIQAIFNKSRNKNTYWLFRFSLSNVIFILHIVVALTYMIVSQIVRLLAIKKLEIQTFFQNINRLCNPESYYSKPHSDEEDSIEEKVNNVIKYNIVLKNEDSVVEIVDKFKYQTFFTTPGYIFPNII